MMVEPKLDVHPLSPEETKRLFIRRNDAAINNKIFGLLENPTSFYGKNYAILGEFGSGKTTIVNYIRYTFVAKGINAYPLDVFWPHGAQEVQSQEIQLWFIGRLLRGLISACNHALPIASTSTKESIEVLRTNLEKNLENLINVDTNEIVEAFEILCGVYKGITILIDELHRIPNHQSVLEFLKSQQTFFQGVCGFPVAIFIAGKPQWERNLDLPQYGGIFDEIVVLTHWTSRNAYELIDSRLREAAAVPSDFKNPFEKDALDRVYLQPEEAVPRKWIKIAKRILENTPEGVRRINAAIVAQALSFVDQSKVEQVRETLKSDYPAVATILNSISTNQLSDAADLLNTIARLYHRPVSTKFSQEERKRIGVLDLPGIMEILSNLGAVIRGKQSSPPVRVKKELVELEYREAWRLDENLESFFEKVEDTWNLIPEDYVLKFLEEEGNIEQDEREEVHNVKQLKTIAGKLRNRKAKAHIRRSIQSYEAFTHGILLGAQVGLPTLRDAAMTIYNITAAFYLERPNHRDREMQLDRDLQVMLRSLNIDDDTTRILLDLNNEYRKVEYNAGQAEEDLYLTLRSRIPGIMDELIDQFYKWAQIAPEKRNDLGASRVIEAWTKKRPTELLLNNAIQTMKTTAIGMNLKHMDAKWVETVFKILQKDGTDRLVAESVDILCFPHFYGKNKDEVFKKALLLLSRAFERILVTIGKNHRKIGIRTVFRERTDLGTQEMIQILFATDKDLGPALRSCSAFDAELKSRGNFEEKIEGLMKTGKSRISRSYRFLALTIMTANHYSDENCEDASANTDEVRFRSIMNAMLGTIISVFKYFSDRNEILVFKIKNPSVIGMGKVRNKAELREKREKYAAHF